MKAHEINGMTDQQNHQQIKTLNLLYFWSDLVFLVVNFIEN